MPKHIAIFLFTFFLNQVWSQRVQPVQYEFYGKVLVTGQMKNGDRHGTWKRISTEGKLLLLGEYKDGKRDGVWKKFDKNGKVKGQWEYKEDVRVGHWVTYGLNNEKLMELVYDSVGRLTTGACYYNNGKLGLLEEYRFDSTDIYLYRSEYFQNGQLYRFTSYKNSEKHGLYQAYHLKGMVWEEMIYDEGKLESVIDMRDISGKPLAYGNFIDGNGILKKYYPIGRLYSEETYVDGVREGTVTYFNKGRWLTKGAYKNGKPIGNWSIRNNGYSLKLELEFYDQYNMKFTHYLSPDQDEANVGFLVNGKRHGQWIWHHPDGSVKFEQTYAFDYRHGAFKHYGTKELIESGVYAFGGKTGLWENYNLFGQKVYSDTLKNKLIPSSNWSPLVPEGWYELIDKGYVTDFNKMFLPQLPGYYLLQDDHSVIERRIEVPKTAIDEGARTTQKIPYKNRYRKLEPENFGVLIHRSSSYLYEPEMKSPGFIDARLNDWQWLDDQFEKKYSEKFLSGYNVVAFHIDEFGLATSSEIILKSGKQADEFVAKYYNANTLFEPASYNGLPVESYVELTIFLTTD